MLKSIQSNNSPGHSHNRRLSVVDLSTDSCPGILLKRNNKMNTITINGKTIHTTNSDISIIDNKVYVDNNEIDVESTRKITIKGMAIMGGIEVKN